MKRILTASLMLLLLIFSGCGNVDGNPTGHTEKIDIYSDLLGKSITSFVYLPYGYDDSKEYATLFFMASAGGSAYTVINQFHITDVADELIQDGSIEPMIIVALGIDFSFGINSAETVGSSTFESEQVYTFAEGCYEDYIIEEAIPYIDAHYATRQDREYRYIGGYSMGGFAALHIGFRHPAMFSKIGGHSPTLFLGTYITPEIDQWLFPTDEERLLRDPIMLVETAELDGISVYLDTGIADVNLDACSVLADKLMNRGVDLVFLKLPGTHGFDYCRQHMKEYLAFYGSLFDNRKE